MTAQSFFSTSRWLVTSLYMERPQVFFVEQTARRQAEAIREATCGAVVVTRQELRDGEWVSEKAGSPPLPPSDSRVA